MPHGFRSILCLAVVVVCASAQPAEHRPTLAELERRAATLLPSRDRLRFQEIPWVHDLAEAQAVARAERRPIFLWVTGDDPLEREPPLRRGSTSRKRQLPTCIVRSGPKKLLQSSSSNSISSALRLITAPA